jgi:hypothetical protein
MNKEFIPYEQALELKELGLLTYKKDNDFGLLYKGSDIPSILYQQAFRWFREKYGIMYTVHNNIENWKNTFHGAYTKINSNYESDYTNDFKTYEEAELACLKKLIEIVKNERK